MTVTLLPSLFSLMALISLKTILCEHDSLKSNYICAWGQLTSPCTPPQSPGRHYPLTPACLYAPWSIPTCLSVCLSVPFSALNCSDSHTQNFTQRHNKSKVYMQGYSGFTGLFVVCGKISFRENEKLLTVLGTPLLPVIISQHLHACLCVCMQCPYMSELPEHIETIAASCNYLQHLHAFQFTYLCASLPVCMQSLLSL